MTYETDTERRVARRNYIVLVAVMTIIAIVVTLATIALT